MSTYIKETNRESTFRENDDRPNGPHFNTYLPILRIYRRILIEKITLIYISYFDRIKIIILSIYLHICVYIDLFRLHTSFLLL